MKTAPTQYIALAACGGSNNKKDIGLAKKSETIAFKPNGDTLKFDGAQYTRVK